MLKLYGEKVMFWKKIIKRYFISILLFIFIVVVLNLAFGNEILTFFVDTFFTNGKLVNDGKHYITGEFKVVKFAKSLVFFLFCIFSLNFFDIAYTLYLDKQKDKIRNLKEIKDRILEISSRKNVETNDDFFEIDNVIKQIISNQEKYKDKYDDNMSKLNLSMAFLAHDLRTPLTSIIGYTDLLSNEKELSSDSKDKYVDIVKNKSLELEELIDQFFTFTKIQLKSENISKSKFDIYEFFVQIKETFYPHITNKNIEIILLVPEKQYIYADPNALARSFNNIMKNAVLYSPINSKIEVKFETEDDYYVISVKNDISSANDINVENLFQPFYRGDYSRNKETKGSGLGLNVAKTIIENHNGEIGANIHNDYIEIVIKLPV